MFRLPTKSLYAALSADVFDVVCDRALRARREPKHEAGLLIEEALRTRGALPADANDLTTTEPRVAAIAAAP